MGGAPEPRDQPRHGGRLPSSVLCSHSDVCSFPEPNTADFSISPPSKGLDLDWSLIGRKGRSAVQNNEPDSGELAHDGLKGLILMHTWYHRSSVDAATRLMRDVIKQEATFLHQGQADV